MKRPFLLTALILFGCPSYPPNDICGYQGACDDGGLDAISDSTPPSDGGCNSATTPGCIDSGNGVFVSPTGSDSNDGSKASPVKTIGAGLTKAKSGSKSNVYVCAGTYADNVEITNAVEVFGGFSCTDWSYATSNVVTIAPSSGMALHIANAPATVVDITMTSADGAAPGSSSVTAFVDTSTVTFARDVFNAGKGMAGANGTSGSNYTSVGQNDPTIAGNGTTGNGGGGPHACTLCTDGNNSVGGGGGNGTLAPTDGQDGTPKIGGLSPNDGMGGAKDVGSGCSNGHKGASGDAGASSASPIGNGSIDAGWDPTSGANGVNGGVAQGGGGGGGGVSAPAGGAAGGGCGGCGGAAGGGGGGGGGSIALLALNSTVTLASSELHATNGGGGGAGSTGQAGQPGGTSGTPAPPGCVGGTGGDRRRWRCGSWRCWGSLRRRRLERDSRAHSRQRNPIEDHSGDQRHQGRRCPKVRVSEPRRSYRGQPSFEVNG